MQPQIQQSTLQSKAKKPANSLFSINGSEIVTLRKKLKMNQQEFWTRIGVTQSGGSRYESGRNIPKPVRIALHIAYSNEKKSAAAVSHLRDWDNA